jgi:sporulation protein YlmC with PRC-barrel domain
MKRFPIFLTSAALGAALALPLPPATAQPVELAVVDVKVVERGYRASKLKDKAVFNEKNERVGEVDDLIVGKDGKTFVVVQVGGFLGIGEKLVAVPYESLQLDQRGDKVVLPGASKDALRKLPVFKYIA